MRVWMRFCSFVVICFLVYVHLGPVRWQPPRTGLGWQLDAQVLLAQKLLSELARDPGGSKFKDLHQQKDDQQLEPMQKPFVGGASGWGSWN
jgi:hypothetical protein